MQIQFELNGLEHVTDAINQALAAFERGEVLETVGATVESQTRRRIDTEKTAPDGSRWANWSASYAKTRHGGHSLLSGRGDLLDSIRSEVRGRQAEVGSNLVYAAAHQDGLDMTIVSTKRRVTIPARPFLGVSEANEREIEQVVNDWLAERLSC